jgi:hypothetical protein
MVVQICALLGYNAASSGNPLPTFRDNVSVPSSGVNKTKLLFLDFLRLEDGTDPLSRNVGKGLPLNAALYPRRAQISSASRRKREVTGGGYSPFLSEHGYEMTRAADGKNLRQATWSANRSFVNADALSFIRRVPSHGVWFLPPTLTLTFMEAAICLQKRILFMHCIVPWYFRGAGRGRECSHK